MQRRSSDAYFLKLEFLYLILMKFTKYTPQWKSKFCEMIKIGWPFTHLRLRPMGTEYRGYYKFYPIH